MKHNLVYHQNYSLLQVDFVSQNHLEKAEIKTPNGTTQLSTRRRVHIVFMHVVLKGAILPKLVLLKNPIKGVGINWKSTSG